MKISVMLLFLISSISFGQMMPPDPTPTSIGIGSMLPSTFEQNYNNNLGREYIKSSVLIENSPFLEDDYQQGKAIIQEKLGFRAKMRYNAAKDVIEFIKEDTITKELLRRPYVSATFGGRQFLIKKYLDGKTEKLGYFNPLNFGYVKLLIMPKKELELGKWRYQHTDNGYGLVAKGYYRDATAHYLMIDKKPAIEINLNKSTILTHLDPTYKNMLDYFITENDLKLRKEEDVIQLLEYYNTIIAQKALPKQIKS